jgi:hypothetical protein
VIGRLLVVVHQSNVQANELRVCGVWLSAERYFFNPTNSRIEPGASPTSIAPQKHREDWFLRKVSCMAQTRNLPVLSCTDNYCYFTGGRFMETELQWALEAGTGLVPLSG